VDAISASSAVPFTSIVRMGKVCGAGSFGHCVGDAAVTAGGGVAGVSRMHFGSGGSSVGPVPELDDAARGDEAATAALGSVQPSLAFTGSAGARLQLTAKTEKTTALTTMARNTGRF
jgi:hypothetical protein